MKYLNCILFLITSINSFAQTGGTISYQAVIRNSTDDLVINRQVGMRISILQGSANGVVVYAETHRPSTNENGLVSLEIGGGIVLSGNFSSIPWSDGPYFIKTETDVKGGRNYNISGTSQLLSVPYALFAVNAESTTPGTERNQMKYWTGSSWGMVKPGNDKQVLRVCNGELIWTDGECPGSITMINCESVAISGSLKRKVYNDSVWVQIPYRGGNGGYYPSLSISSTGVNGFTAYLNEGYFAKGDGFLLLKISGLTTELGNALFELKFGVHTCTLTIPIKQLLNVPSLLPPVPTFCLDSETEIVDIISPTTGQTWMDRNLGATQAANSLNDELSYGDLYQWGRWTDGHQCRNSPVNKNLPPNSLNIPKSSDFLLGNKSNNYDWRTPSNDNLWINENVLDGGITADIDFFDGNTKNNDPCPRGYRLPTWFELDWEIKSAGGAKNAINALKLPLAGLRSGINGSLQFVGVAGEYWLRTGSNKTGERLSIDTADHSFGASYRSNGASVRCFKETQTFNLNCRFESISNPLIDYGNNSVQAKVQVSAFVVEDSGLGYAFNTSTFQSSGITGLSAVITADTLFHGETKLSFNISGVPERYGQTTFIGNLGKYSCSFMVQIHDIFDYYPNSNINCNVLPTPIIDVVNPNTGKIWMDRNLGANQVATSRTDINSFGDLYQWGRRSDGHQCRNSNTTNNLSSSIQPSNSDFILSQNTTGDWLTIQNVNLWQARTGLNNPCPYGYRLPTEAELNNERLSWSVQNANGAFNSPLRLPTSGTRNYSNGLISNLGAIGGYWSSTINGNLAKPLYFDADNAFINSSYKADGFSIRCTKSDLHIGMNFQGGVIAHILQPGESGYDPNIEHGLIIAPSKIVKLGLMTSRTFTRGTSTLLGHGANNTNIIMQDILDYFALNSVYGYLDKDGDAIGYTYFMEFGGYDDWFTPSFNELSKIMLNRNTLALPNDGTFYHSSSLNDLEANWQMQYTSRPAPISRYKWLDSYVIPTRYF